jgi:hypothetical protein
MQKLFLGLLLSANVMAATVIDKGQVSPYKGFLFTEQEEQQLRDQSIELEADKQRIQLLMEQSKIYESNQKIMQEQVTLWRDQAHSLAKINAEKQELQFWKNTFFFTLGAALTTAIVYGVSHAQR